MLPGMLAAIVSVLLVPTTLISNGMVYDGTGADGRLASIRIRGAEIVEIGALQPEPGEAVVDAKGMVIAPGFIDAHSHADGGIDEDPLALSQLTQGITTAVVGQDGYWGEPAKAALGGLKFLRPAINFATFSGHGGIRRQVMKEDYKRTATESEIVQMEALLRADMRSGSLGLSSGLEYDPGYYADTEELIRLAKVAGEGGGMYISHVRDESDRAFEAFQELVTIGRSAKIHAQISHIKLGTAAVWGKAKESDAIGAAEGITADVYPYLYWQSGLAALSPSRDWDNPKIWEKGLADVGGPQNVRLTRYTHEPTWVGKTLVQISELTGKTPIALIQEILRKTSGPGGTGSQSVVVTAMTEADLSHFIASPRTMFCSDGSIGGSHPRGAGSFPRILGRYVREKKLIPMREAIRKMTSMVAKTFQLKDLGELKPGYRADIVIFNPDTIIDHATPENPRALSTGVEHVWVGGTHTLANGKATGERSGAILLRDRWPSFK